jgi:hypothetical protein
MAAALGGGTGAGGGAAMGGTAGQLIGLPPAGTRADHVPATPFAILYRSIFTIQAGTDPNRAGLLARLKHVNCDYLSTRGVPPSLLQLKQHAQALVVLIKNITVSTLPGLIDNANAGIAGGAQRTAFNDAETFNFLNDLSKLYEGPIDPAYMPHHKMPLHALMNILGENVRCQDGEPVPGSVENICPYHEVEPSELNGKNLPYAQRTTLIYHANEILELLDHEYSAKGGILAILPDKNSNDPVEREQYNKSQTTLLGQMIQQHQRLVMRIHDLERVYSNALDALAGEAAVPPQQLSKLGPDARKGRDLVFPQDRFVLANCGEDVWDYLDYQFTRKENSDDATRLMNKKAGVIGSDMWRRSGQREYERGITVLDVNTRYIRMRKDPLKTIFIIPAHENHPGTQATRDMEKVPTVVSVVKPIWPERASIWEMKNREKIDELKKLKDLYDRAKHDLEVSNNAREIMQESEKQYRLINASLKKKLEDCLTKNKPDETEAIATIATERDEAVATKQATEALQAKLVADKAILDDQIKKNNAEKADLQKERDAFLKARAAAQEADKVATDIRLAAVEKLEAEAATNANELYTKLANLWKPQLEETNALKAVLDLRKQNMDVTLQGEDAAAAAGLAIGTAAWNTAVSDYRLSKGWPALDPNDPQSGMGMGAQPEQQEDSDVDMDFI